MVIIIILFLDCEDDNTKKDSNGKEFQIPENWPTAGAVEGKGVSMAYRYDTTKWNGNERNERNDVVALRS